MVNVHWKPGDWDADTEAEKAASWTVEQARQHFAELYEKVVRRAMP
jgi:hypothetical protein